jgi:hypothetical protein
MTSFVSLTETREAAEKVYGGITSVPSGWQVDSTFGDGGERQGPSGGYVYALKPSGVDDGRRMLVFRGTEVTLTNMKDLFADVTDIGKTQFSELDEFVNPWLARQLVDGNRVELVGHSLGGALVQWAINDTNMRDDNLNNNLSSVLEIARTLPDPITGIPNPSFQIDPSKLHFTTFNAPGITYVSGLAATDRTTVVNGEHHVVSGSTPYISGDPIHLLGGPPVGGTVIGHQVNFVDLGERGLFAHDIHKPEYWDVSQSPIVSYTPPYMDIGVAQSYAAHFSQLGNTDGTVTGDFEAVARLGLFLVASGVALGANTVALATQLRGLSFDRDVFASTIALPVNGINQGLAMIMEAAEAAGQNVVDLSARLSNGVVDLLHGIGSFAGQVPGFMTNTIVPFLTDTAHGISNAVSDFLHDIPGTLFDLGRTLTFSDLNPFTSAYAQALEDPRLDSSLRTALEEAQQIVLRAGQTVVIQTGVGLNPFQTPGYVPGGVSSATVEERLGELFRLSLPFAAGVGGQRISLSLQGPSANQLSIVTDDGVQPVGAHGTVEVVVPEGADQVLFSLVASDEVSANATVTLSATLMDETGQAATHLPQVESTISVKALVGTTDERYETYEEDWSGITDPNSEGVAMGVGALTRLHQQIQRVLGGAAHGATTEGKGVRFS